MWACRTWFDQILETKIQQNEKLVLIFNSTGDRSAQVLLAPLMSFPWTEAIFCTNVTKEADMASDNTNLNFSFDYALRKVQSNKETWDQLEKMENSDVTSHACPHIEDALRLVEGIKAKNNEDKVSVFVTGSLHLVGGVLSFIKPECYEKTTEEMQKELELMQTYTKLGNDQSPSGSL